MAGNSIRKSKEDWLRDANQYPSQCFIGRSSTEQGHLQVLDVATAQAMLGTGTSDHNSLTGLQGGSLAERYHLTSAQAVIVANTSGVNTGDQTITLSGDVTGSGTAGIAATVANDAITNAKAANMATQTFKGRNTAGTGDPEDLSVATAKTMLGISLPWAISQGGTSSTTGTDAFVNLYNDVPITDGGSLDKKTGFVVYDTTPGSATTAFSYRTSDLINDASTTTIAAITSATASSWIPRARASVSKTANYTATTTDGMIRGATAGGAFQITLPTAVGVAGKQYSVLKTDSSANNLTIGTTGGQTINGAASLIFNGQWRQYTVESDGANWIIVADTLAAPASGKITISDGAAWIVSTTVWPNALTTNSILFASATNTVGQNNNAIQWDDTNSIFTVSGSSLGTAPASPPAGTYFHVIGDKSTGGAMTFDAYGGAAGVLVRRAQGSMASPTAVVSGQDIGGFYGGGWYTSGGTAFATNKGNIIISAAETFTSTANGTNVRIQTTPTGSTSPANVVTFLAAGNVQFNNAANFSANGAVATVLTGVGPTGASTTVQEWLTIKNAAGTTRYIPCF